MAFRLRDVRDWADIADLMDLGVEVHFVYESVDLQTRSGRLSADIIAVGASEYIRNLRDEVKKGIQGRLEKGLLPFSAPLGYLNTGKGKVKIPDPERAPLKKGAFEFFKRKQFTVSSLAVKM